MLPVVSMTNETSSVSFGPGRSVNVARDFFCSVTVIGKSPGSCDLDMSLWKERKRSKLRLSSQAPAVSRPDWPLEGDPTGVVGPVPTISPLGARTPGVPATGGELAG